MTSNVTDPYYCPGCEHPKGYHGAFPRGCSMPVLKGTNQPKGRNDDARACETCKCTNVFDSEGTIIEPTQATVEPTHPHYDAQGKPIPKAQPEKKWQTWTITGYTDSSFEGNDTAACLSLPRNSVPGVTDRDIWLHDPQVQLLNHRPTTYTDEGSSYRYDAKGFVFVLECVCRPDKVCLSHQMQADVLNNKIKRAEQEKERARVYKESLAAAGDDKWANKKRVVTEMAARLNEAAQRHEARQMPLKSDFEEAILPSATRSRA